MKKKAKILIILVLFILATGCTKQLKDGKEVVQNPATGQTLTANILCKPDDKEIIDKWYPNKDYHNLIIGKIEKVLVKE